MDILKFDGRYNSVITAVNSYEDYTDSQKKKMEELFLTFPFENTIQEFSSKPVNTFSAVSTIEISKFKVDHIKKWDILYAHHGNVVTPHYHIVLKVIKDKVYCLTITSEKRPFADLEITKSRQLKGYICNTLTIIPLNEAKNKFVFVYEGSRKEVVSIFNLIKEQINSI